MAGVYEVKLEGQKKPSREVDWQIKTNGVWTEDWAVWSASYLVVYDNMNGATLNLAKWTNSTTLCGDAQLTNIEREQDGGHYRALNAQPSDCAYKQLISNSFLSLSELQFVKNLTIQYWSTDESTGGWSKVKIFGTQVYYATTTGVGGKYKNITLVKNNSQFDVYLNYTTYVTTFTPTDNVMNFTIFASSGGATVVSYDNLFDVSYYMTNGSVLLNSPANNYISPSNSVDFNCSATVTGGATLVNRTVILYNNDGTINQTNFSIVTGTTNTSVSTLNLISGTSYNWTATYCDSDGDCGFASENRTISIDTQAPTITINSPTSLMNYGTLGGSETLNYSIIDTNFASAWYNYNGTNVSLAGASNTTTFTIDRAIGNNLTIWANDSVGNVASLNRDWNYTLGGNSINYSASTIATSNETFTLNLTYTSSNWLGISAKINYNGTEHISTKTGTGNNLIFTNSLLVPNPATNTNYNFFWNVSLTNATGTYYITTTSLAQAVAPLQIINITSSACGAGFSSAFNFTSLIESNLSAINFTTVNYNLQYGSSGNMSALVSSGTLSNIATFNICINSSATYYVGYGEIQYQVEGYSARRFYIFLNTRLINTTIANNLYSLETASSTPFQITATDTTLSAYVGYYIGLLRWYPDLDTYKVVDMGKTDALGQTVVNVKTNEVDYRLALYSPDGTLVKLLDPIRMVCQTTPCVYSLIVDLSGVDLTTFLDIQSSLTFDTTTKVFTYVFNDPSQDTTSMNLTVWQDKGNADSEIICSTTSNSFTGILVCDVSSYTGQLRAEVYRSASPKILIAQKLVDIRNSLMDVEGGKTMVLFIGLILTITMALMGVVSPPLVVILSVIALIPLMFLGLFSVALLVLIGAIGGIILHMLRRIS
jgi:hypothetical protein